MQKMFIKKMILRSCIDEKLLEETAGNRVAAFVKERNGPTEDRSDGHIKTQSRDASCHSIGHNCEIKSRGGP